MGEQMLSIADEADDTALRVAAHYALGDLHYWRPHYRKSIYHFDQAIALYNQAEHHVVGHRVIGYDPGVASVGFRAVALWYLGFPDQALQDVIRARELARQLKSPICSAMTDFLAAIVHNLRREPEQALTFAKHAWSVSREEGFDYFEAGSLVQLGWAISLAGSVDEGIQRIREGLTLNESIGGRLERPFYLFALGECLAKTSHLEQAAAVVEEGIKFSRRALSQFHEPALLCLKAELLSRRPVPDFHEAGACLRRALRMTYETGAKSLELRAALSLCCLERRLGCPEEWETLAAAPGFFTEGFETKELKQAAVLLASREIGDPKAPYARADQQTER